MTRLRFASAAALLALALVAVACSTGSGGGGGGGGGGGRGEGGGDRTPDPGTSGEVILEITRGDETVARWSLEQIEAELDFVEATIDGEDHRGPRLLDLLDASAVESWSKIEISGEGPQRAFGVAIKVESSAVDERWLLAVSRRGDLKLVSPSLARERWIRDVSEIDIVE